MKSKTNETQFEPLTSGRFRFDCHPKVPCFTECCRDLNLMLTPYDLLRLKNRFHMSSRAFLEEYTEPHLDEGETFPKVRLRMGAEPRRPCPFVSSAGCTVYEDRPSACRIYPLGRATARNSSFPRALERFFLVRESHCRGFEEPRQWTVEQWIQDQELTSFQNFNDLWTEIVTHPGALGQGETRSKKIQMFYMASYDLDTFRRFVLDTSFLRSFDIGSDEVRELRTRDEALLDLAFRWLLFALYGKNTLVLRSEKTTERG